MHSRVDLLLPLRHGKRGLLSDAALIQTLITWSSNYPEGRILTYVNDDKTLNEFCQTDIGFIAAVRAADLLPLNKGESLRHAVRAPLKERAVRMQNIETARHGAKIFLACVDQSTMPHPACLYAQIPGEDKVRDQREFERLGKTIINLMTKFYNPQDAPQSLDNEGLGTSFGAILWEIFRNTHDWARWDIQRTRVQRSVRGIRVEAYQARLTHMQENAAGSFPLGRYLKHPVHNHPKKYHHRILDISIFDAGPGLASRWHNKPLSELTHQEEVAGVRKCLEKHGTSSTSAQRGIGFDHVFDLLTKTAGLLRMRTGHLHLQRDFILHPYDPKHPTPTLYDWTGDTDPKAYASARGTVLSFLLPLTTMTR